jgi:hypothetical protein
MLVQILSDKRKEMLTGFIGLIPVQEATGEKIFNLIDEEIKRCGQCLANCIGFATGWCIKHGWVQQLCVV